MDLIRAEHCIQWCSVLLEVDAKLLIWLCIFQISIANGFDFYLVFYTCMFGISHKRIGFVNDRTHIKKEDKKFSIKYSILKLLHQKNCSGDPNFSGTCCPWFSGILRLSTQRSMCVEWLGRFGWSVMSWARSWGFSFVVYKLKIWTTEFDVWSRESSKFRILLPKPTQCCHAISNAPFKIHRVSNTVVQIPTLREIVW